MANIIEFDAGNLAIRPSETGVEAAAAAGRRIGAFYNQGAEGLARAGAEVGSAVKTAEDYVDHQQIRAGAASSVQLFADQLQAKDAAIKSVDINDPHYAEKVEGKIQEWRDQSLNPALDQFRNGFTTQKAQDWADEFINKTRQTMFAHSTADIQDAAAIGFHNSAKTIVNTATNTVFQDPSMLKSQLDIVEHGMTGLIQSSPVKGIQGAKILSEGMEQAKEQMVKSAVQGAIMKGGNWQSIAKQYPEYVNGAEMAQFERAQRTQDRFFAAQNKAIELAQKQEADLNLGVSMNNLYDKYHHVTADGHEYYDPQYGQEMQKLVHQYGQAPNAKNLVSASLKDFEAVTDGRRGTFNDPDTQKDIATSLYNPNASATDNKIKILEAASAGKITPQTKADYLELNQALSEGPIKDPIFSTSMKNAEQILGTDIEGRKNFADFQSRFLQEYLTERKDGKLQPGDLTVNVHNPGDEPKSLIDKVMKPYLRDPQKVMLDTIFQRAGVPAGIVGEEAATPAAAATVTLPPEKDRVEGQAYPTPRGLMTWTSKGWLAPSGEVTMQP